MFSLYWNTSETTFLWNLTKARVLTRHSRLVGVKINNNIFFIVKEMGVLSLLVSLFCGLVSIICMMYLSPFIMNMDLGPYIRLAVPQYSDYVCDMITIDSKPEWNNFVIPFLRTLPLLNNALLLALFGLQHSGTQRGLFKRILNYCVPEAYHRPAFVLNSALCLFAMYLLWIPMTTTLWNITHPLLKFLVYAFSVFGWGGTVFSLLNLDPMMLLGVSDNVDSVLGRYKQASETKLVTSGLYGLMRHPTYSFTLLSMWVTPKMSVGHCLLAIAFTTYVAFAVAMFEEPALVKEFGQDYVEYAKRTPMYVPRLPWLTKHKKV